MDSFDLVSLPGNLVAPDLLLLHVVHQSLVMNLLTPVLFVLYSVQQQHLVGLFIDGYSCLLLFLGFESIEVVDLGGEVLGDGGC